MSSLFQKVYRLLNEGNRGKEEDFLTELFAEIFKNPEIVASFFFHFLNKNVFDTSELGVTTQYVLPKLPHHQMESRPDMVLQFKSSCGKHIAFFENKLSTFEHGEQLSRYADHLKHYQDIGYDTHLVYITHHRDPKQESDIFKNGKTAVFTQIRWFQIFNWLLQWRPNVYIDLLLSYMEEMQLNQSRRFSPQDIYALQNLNRLQAMMDECLDGPVDELMCNLFGKPIGWSNRNVQLRDFNRYFKVNDQNGYIWVGCGFYFTGQDEYPEPSVVIEVNPNYPLRQDIIHAFGAFMTDHPNWKGYDLETKGSWCNISYRKNMLEILMTEDHVHTAQQFFLDGLNELNELKTKYPQFHWK